MQIATGPVRCVPGMEQRAYAFAGRSARAGVPSLVGSEGCGRLVELALAWSQHSLLQLVSHGAKPSSDASTEYTLRIEFIGRYPARNQRQETAFLVQIVLFIWFLVFDFAFY
eukprot:1379604-Rhodomonas_salina.2